MSRERVPQTEQQREAYHQRVRQGPCFICAMTAGHPEYAHEVILDDGDHVGFLSRYPTLYGYVLVAPRRHVEHVVRDVTVEQYLALQAVIYRVARAVETVVAPERTYLLSLGSQQGNSHVHWHIAPLPPGTPYEQQQFHALMGEYGMIGWERADAEDLAARLRSALGA
jgi:histidine triad (HIT) family protein/ATP adenylyltransferase